MGIEGRNFKFLVEATPCGGRERRGVKLMLDSDRCCYDHPSRQSQSHALKLFALSGISWGSFFRRVVLFARMVTSILSFKVSHEVDFSLHVCDLRSGDSWGKGKKGTGEVAGPCALLVLPWFYLSRSGNIAPGLRVVRVV